MNKFNVGDTIRLPTWPEGDYLLITRIKMWDYIGDFYDKDTGILFMETFYSSTHSDWELVVTDLEFYKDVAKL